MVSRGLETIISRSLLSKAALCSSKLEKISSKRMIGLLGLTEDRNSSFQRGASNAPSHIRQHFLMPSVNSWCELGVDLHDRIIDYGDIQPEERHHRDIYDAIRCKMDEIQRIDGLVPLILGGDHSITFSTCTAVRNFVGKPLVIIHFDAHPDIYENFEDNPSSHASPFARICEVPGLCKKLIQIGIRTLSGEQMPQIAKYGVEIVEARNFPAKGSDIREIFEKFIISDKEPVYISVDIDVLEPLPSSFIDDFTRTPQGLAPGVSHREAGGLTTRQLIDAIHCIPGMIVGADIVEYNPERDVDFITASVSAKIMKEIAGKIIVSQSLRK